MAKRRPKSRIKFTNRGLIVGAIVLLFVVIGTLSYARFGTVWPTFAAGKTYYVSPAGDDYKGDGTMQYPFKTIYYALQKVMPGGGVYVLSGTYLNQGPITYIKHASETTSRTPITLQGQSGAVIALNPVTGGFLAVKSDVRNLKIRGLTFNIQGDAIALSLRGSENITIDGNTFTFLDSSYSLEHRMSTTGFINVDTARNIGISNNKLVGPEGPYAVAPNWHAGIVAHSVQSLRVQNNTITGFDAGVYIDGSRATTAGGGVTPPSIPSYNISGNTITEVSQAVLGNHVTATSCTISGNTINNTGTANVLGGGAAINMTGGFPSGQDSLRYLNVRDNNFTGVGFSAHAIRVAERVDRVTVYHNTIASGGIAALLMSNLLPATSVIVSSNTINAAGPGISLYWAGVGTILPEIRANTVRIPTRYYDQAIQINGVKAKEYYPPVNNIYQT